MSVPTTEPVCYIVGAGECGGLNFSKTTGDLVIAADGGLTYLEREGIAPDLVLGDFDSLEGDRPSGNVLTYPSEKDETDMFLAVRYAVEHGFQRIEIYGGLGGRLDHTLANIQTIVWAARRGVRARLLDTSVALYAVTDGELRFPAGQRGGVSVFCSGERAEGVDLIGLKYPLNNAALTDEFPLGVSNEFTGRESVVRVRRGTLVVLTDSAVQQKR